MSCNQTVTTRQCPPPAPNPCPSTPPEGEDICFLDAVTLRNFMRRRLLSPVDVVEAYIARTQRINPSINAYIMYTFDMARQQAAASDARYRAGNPLPLDGIPVGTKDLFDFVAGVRNTFGCLVFKDVVPFVPDHSAVYVQFMLDAGAVNIGRTNTPEFGHRGCTDNLAYGPTSTPFNIDFNAGGSSGGSSAAVSSFIAALAEGSDAGGSVRIPAALSGCVGFKMTFGRIPQDRPVMTYSPLLHPGPMARTVSDVAMLADIMAQRSTRDNLSLPNNDGQRYLANVNGGISGRKILYTPDFGVFPVEQKVINVVEAALDAFCQSGATVDRLPSGAGLEQLTLDITNRPYTQKDGSDVWLRQQGGLYAHANDMLMHPPAPGIPGIDLRDFQDMLSPEFYNMIMLGYSMSMVEYRHDEFIRESGASGVNGITWWFENQFENYDYIVSPTVAVTGVRNTTDGNTLGPTEINGVVVDPQIGWCLTYLENYTGHPSISIPAGLAEDGLPVGLQIVGRRWQDTSVLQAARAVETRRPWSQLYPRDPMAVI